MLSMERRLPVFGLPTLLTLSDSLSDESLELPEDEDDDEEEEDDDDDESLELDEESSSS